MENYLKFDNQKNQWKWFGETQQLKDLLFKDLGLEDSFISDNSSSSCTVLKFDAITVQFYTSTKTVQIQGSSKSEYDRKLRELLDSSPAGPPTFIVDETLTSEHLEDESEQESDDGGGEDHGNKSITEFVTKKALNTELGKIWTALRSLERLQELEKENSLLKSENQTLKTRLKNQEGILNSAPKGQRHSSPGMQNNGQNQQPITSQRSNAPQQKDSAPQLNRDTPRKNNNTVSIMLIGDSMLKHIDPKKLSQKQVAKKTYPGKKIEEIESEIISSASVEKDSPKPSLIIIHAGTNNLPTDTAEDCTNKLLNLVRSTKEKYPQSRIGVSGLTLREDVDVVSKITEVNRRVQAASKDQDFSFIDNSRIDKTCLNGMKLHLNAKGSSYLASHFIRFLRSDSSYKQQGFQRQNHNLGEQLSKILLQLVNPSHSYRGRR